MAKAKLNSGLNQLAGALDSWVYKQTPHGTTVSRKGKPAKWSAWQYANRERMKNDAANFYHEQMRDPVRAAHYRARAKQRAIPVSAFVMGGYMKHGQAFAALEVPATPPADEALGRDAVDTD